MTDEQNQKMKDYQKQYRENMTDEQKQRYRINITDKEKQYRENKADEQKQKNKRLSITI